VSSEGWCFKTGALLGSLWALLPGVLLAQAQPVVVTGLDCRQISCETGPGARPGNPTVSLAGIKSSQAGAALALLVVNGSDEIVVKEKVPVSAEGAFGATINVSGLQEGHYRFVLFANTQPPSAIARGEFRVNRGGEGQGAAAPSSSPASPSSSRRSTSGEGMAVHQADPVKVFRAESISPDGPTVRPPAAVDRSSRNAAPPAPAQDPSDDGFRAAPRGNTAPDSPPGLGSFFRTFGLAIPGVAYTFDNYATNTRTLTISSGAVTRSAIQVNPDGTYIWISAWDEKTIRGAWRQQGDSIIILKGQSGLDWRLSRLTPPQGRAEVTLWDQNSIWYHGTPPPAGR
jgi:hypothetical protein